MPQNQWSAKRERQSEHIKSGLKSRGKGEKLAEEIAARTVNKERAQHGEAREAGRSSIDDVSAGHRGGKRSHSGEQGCTYEQLYNEARSRGVKGRSGMRPPGRPKGEYRSAQHEGTPVSKAELLKAVGR